MIRHKWIIGAVAVLVAALLVLTGFEVRQRGRIETVIASAQEKLGLPYILNEEGPDAYDCSSLMQACFAEAGVELPRNSAEIGYLDVQRVEDIGKLLRGDLVCWDTVNDQDLTDHMGVYLGEGMVLHASTGRKKVVIDSMEGYFTEHFSWGLRMIPHLPFDLPQPGAESSETFENPAV